MQTYTYTTDASPGNEAVKIQGAWAKRVKLYPNSGSSSVGFSFTSSAPGSAAVTKAPGDAIELVGPPQGWPQGTIIGYTSALAGSLTMAQEEHEA